MMRFLLLKGVMSEENVGSSMLRGYKVYLEVVSPCVSTNILFYAEIYFISVATEEFPHVNRFYWRGEESDKKHPMTYLGTV